MQAREQDHGGKERSEAGVQFLVQNLNEMGVRARVVSGPSGGKASVVEISGPDGACRIWVKTLKADFDAVFLSQKQEWEFHGCRLLVVVANFRHEEETHSDAAIYALCESEAKGLADSGHSIPKSKFREWARGQAADEWRRKLRGVVG